MQLYLADTINRLRVKPEYFFRLAHQWRFGRDVDTSRDALEYTVGGIIPLYVQEYVVHIQKNPA